MVSEKPIENPPQVKKKLLNVLPDNPETDSGSVVGLGRFPSWLHRKLPPGGNLFSTTSILKKHGLNTVCEEAKCPNRFECYSNKTATFLALGKECTRSCGFCDIDFSKTPKAPQKDEPLRIANSVQDLGLKHVVITMVARDDLEDGGANHIAEIIRETRRQNSAITIEVLTSDFAENMTALDIVLDEAPEVFNHNIETVRSLTPRVRHKAQYDRTLRILSHAKQRGTSRFVKSGLMVGLGETKEEVYETLRDLHKAGCDIVTIGHYLQADRLRLPVKSFVTPEDFADYEKFGHEIGIKHVYAGPFVRSSYNASLIQELALEKVL